MAPLLAEVGVKEGQLGIVPKAYKVNTLAAAFDWLHEIYMSPEYSHASRVFRSLPPDAWDRYRLLDITEMTEQIVLAEAGKPLHKLWKTKRPRLFKSWNKEHCEKCDVITRFEYTLKSKVCGVCGEETELNLEFLPNVE